jgi:phage baseplate assembly protein W
MAGIDRHSGKPLDGWSHVEQSIIVLLTTPKMSRVMRRALGADLPRLVDSPITPANVIDFYAACAKAIGDYEPRFRVSRMAVDGAAAGKIGLTAYGVYYPRGHLGDFSVSIPKNVTVPL